MKIYKKKILALQTTRCIHVDRRGWTPRTLGLFYLRIKGEVWLVLGFDLLRN